MEQIFDWFREENTLVMVDPVMGDGGKLYKTYTPQMADGMARLCRRADIVVPNMTEACHLLGRPYNPGPYTQGEIEEILQGLCALGPRMAVLTGVWLQEGALGTACYDSQVGEAKLFLTDRIEGFYHGTGDLFASALLGGLLNGAPLEEACALATEFTWRTIETTGAPLRPPLKRAQTTASAPSSSAICPGWGRRWRSCAKTIPEPSEASIKVF